MLTYTGILLLLVTDHLNGCSRSLFSTFTDNEEKTDTNAPDTYKVCFQLYCICKEALYPSSFSTVTVIELALLL